MSLATVVQCFFFILAALIGFESNNKYEVRNVMGQNVFYAVEENDCLSRQCCGPLRSFTIHILDNFGQEIITVTRPLKCMSCFFPCCLQEVRVTRFRHILFVYVPFEHQITHCLHLAPHLWFLHVFFKCWLEMKLCSLIMLHSAGGAGSPRQHSGLCDTTVASLLP